MFLFKLFTFCGGSRAWFPHPHFCDTWRRGFRPQKCVKSVKSEAFPGESGLAVGASLRCFVFHYLELGWGTFLGKMRLKSVSAPLLVFTCSPVLCFSAFGHFFRKHAIFTRGLLWDSYSAVFFLGKYALFFCYVDLFAFWRFVSRYFRASENFNDFLGGIFGALLFCFPAFGARRA